MMSRPRVEQLLDLQPGSDANGKVIDVYLKRRSSICGFHLPIQIVEDLFSVPAVGDQVPHAQQPEVMAHRRLRQGKLFAQRADVSFSFRQKEKNVQPGLVRQESEDGNQWL